MAHFVLCCQACGREYDGGTAFRLRCDDDLNGRHCPALLRAKYERGRIEIRRELPGVFKFADWLPSGPYYLRSSQRPLGEPYCYRSSRLAERLRLRNLYIAFSGYWPGGQANLVTRTFKEFEVQASLVCILQAAVNEGIPPLIVASAGNTANSYNYYAHLADLPLYLVVPESGLHNLSLPFETRPRLVAVEGDYTDAIDLADRLAQRCGLTRDGGAFNPGRRGGMGTAMLNAVCHPEQGSRRLFDHYFQAIGSGSGAIAAWEAVQLLRRDGRFGDVNTKIHLAQNEPFIPVVNAWKKRQPQLPPIPDGEAYAQIAAVTAGVLTNRRPPYGVKGGLWDILTDTGGETWSASNADVFQMARMFYALEGVDIGPAAAVALDALCQAVRKDTVKPDDYILLHVTGGGREIQFSERCVYRPEPAVRVQPDDVESAIAAIGAVDRLDRTRVAAALAAC